MVCEKDPALKNRCHIRYMHLFSTIKYKVSISVSNALGHNATAITFDEFTIGAWGPCLHTPVGVCEWMLARGVECCGDVHMRARVYVARIMCIYLYAWRVYTCEYLSECPLPAGAKRPLQQLFPSSLWLPEQAGGGGGRLGQTPVQLQPPPPHTNGFLTACDE